MEKVIEKPALTEHPALRVLHQGESCLISRHISDLEITLYRPVPADGSNPLFFDTTACLFNEYGRQTDYVGVGRATTNNKGLLLRPHIALKADDRAELTTNLLDPSSGLSVLPGDGLSLNLKRFSMTSGISVCATLFSVPSVDVTDTYYVVKKPQGVFPLAIVPVTVTPSLHCSCIALMIRKLKVSNESNWEIVCVGEFLEQKDVKGVVTALQSRGLDDPVTYSFDSSHLLGSFTDPGGDDGSFWDDDDDELETSADEGGYEFETLLLNIPRVAREARRQYNVGRSTMNAALEDGDSSDNDEVMKDALRAVVPRYTSACAVRYEGETYNVGSRAAPLTKHYVTHREEYGLSTLGTIANRQICFPPILASSSSSSPQHRLSYGTTAFERPPIPPEFLAAQATSARRKSCVGHGRRHGRSPGPRRFSRKRSSSRRGRSVRSSGSTRRSKGKGRRSRSGKGGRSRSSSATRSRRKGTGGRKSTSAGKRCKSNKRGGSSKSKKRKSRSRSRLRESTRV